MKQAFQCKYKVLVRSVDYAIVKVCEVCLSMKARRKMQADPNKLHKVSSLSFHQF